MRLAVLGKRFWVYDEKVSGRFYNVEIGFASISLYELLHYRATKKKLATHADRVSSAICTNACSK
jgi:hypothetical protein